MALAAGVSLDRGRWRRWRGARSLSPWRMALHERADGVVVVNDAYNANPASMDAALDALAAIGERGGRRTVAVLGEMLELGDVVGRRARRGRGARGRRSGSTSWSPSGRPREAIADGARRTPGWSGEAVPTAGREQAAAWLRHNVVARDVVLVKASRGAALEHVADVLTEPDAAGSEPGRRDPSR